jgi:ABC-type xylose transport system substrate-binding protein
MPKEIDFSSYECDGGHQSHFFANTIKEAKAMSQKRTVRLGGSEADEHAIVFEHGKMVEILCPQTDSQRHSRRKGARRRQ